MPTFIASAYSRVCLGDGGGGGGGGGGTVLNNYLNHVVPRVSTMINNLIFATCTWPYKLFKHDHQIDLLNPTVDQHERRPRPRAPEFTCCAR